jgi:hypothetical protein
VRFAESVLVIDIDFEIRNRLTDNRLHIR